MPHLWTHPGNTILMDYVLLTTRVRNERCQLQLKVHYFTNNNNSNNNHRDAIFSSHFIDDSLSGRRVYLVFLFYPFVGGIITTELKLVQSDKINFV